MTNTVISPLIVTVEKIWKDLQTQNASIPAVAVTFGAETSRNKQGVKLERFAPNRWNKTTVLVGLEQKFLITQQKNMSHSYRYLMRL